MEGCFVNMTKISQGYTWNIDWEDMCKLHMGCHENLNLRFVEILSTCWHDAVDRDWRSKLHVLKHTSQPPDWPCP